jgi:hypothetical protein
MEGPSGHPPESFSLQSGETVRVRLSGGAANVYLGRAVSVDIGGEQFRLTELIVHSPEWKAAMAGPGSDEGFRIWIE